MIRDHFHECDILCVDGHEARRCYWGMGSGGLLYHGKNLAMRTRLLLIEASLSAMC